MNHLPTINFGECVAFQGVQTLATSLFQHMSLNKHHPHRNPYHMDAGQYFASRDKQRMLHPRKYMGKWGWIDPTSEMNDTHPEKKITCPLKKRARTQKERFRLKQPLSFREYSWVLGGVCYGNLIGVKMLQHNTFGLSPFPGCWLVTSKVTWNMFRFGDSNLNLRLPLFLGRGTTQIIRKRDAINNIVLLGKRFHVVMSSEPMNCFFLGRRMNRLWASIPYVDFLFKLSSCPQKKVGVSTCCGNVCPTNLKKLIF